MNKQSYEQRRGRGQNYRSRDNRKSKYNYSNEKIVKYLFDSIDDLSKYRYDILNRNEDLNKLLNTKYYVSPNYFGKNAFLIFTKINEKFYSVVIERNTLKFDISKIDIERVKIIHVNVDVDTSLFDGTILDGIYNNRDGKHSFIITDVFKYKNCNYLSNKLDIKLTEIKLYLDNIPKFTNEKIHVNRRYNLTLKMNQYYELSNIRELIEKKIYCRGLCFMPEITGTKLIYVMNDNDKNFTPGKKNIVPSNIRENNKIQRTSSSNTKNKIINVTYISKTTEAIYANLQMKATDIPDNYKMYAFENIERDGRIRKKKFQMDIAYIPNMKKSKWCREITGNTSNGVVMVNCLWNNNKKKWEPMTLCKNIKVPTNMTEIRKYLLEMEDSGSDSDSD
jgi:hypothetical protein